MNATPWIYYHEDKTVLHFYVAAGAYWVVGLLKMKLYICKHSLTWPFRTQARTWAPQKSGGH